VKSNVLFFAKQFAEAIKAAQTAVTLDPYAAYAYYAMATLNVRATVKGFWEPVLAKLPRVRSAQ
jgi:hypothetical protein